MLTYKIIKNDHENPTPYSREDIADFLFEHLDEYGDSRDAIHKCIAYAFGDGDGQDGHILLAYDQEQIAGVVIINKTNMSDYIPENILVYIAVHGDYRGKGVGSALMKHIIEKTEGDIALHVEPDNPATFLYEKYGFTNKYLEYRLTR